MTPLDQLAELFDQAIALPADQRPSFVRELGAQQPELGQQLRELLAADSQVDVVLDQPPELSHADADELVRPSDDTRLEGELVNATIGSFRVLHRLGAGSMAEVYEAEQSAPRRRVALKILRFDQANSLTAQRFASEAETLARLDHANIARILGAGVHESPTGALSWLAMELVADPTPITAFCQKNQLDRDDRVRMFLSVCDAVHHAHRRGFLHRDLKPANVVVPATAGADAHHLVKVIDFGIARLLSKNAAELARTQAGELIGTVLYMSPEQARGDHDNLDVRSEVYSLAVLLFEMLLERHPHLHGDEAMLTALTKIQRASALNPSATSPALPDDLGAILSRALQPDPELRYDGVLALRDDLRRFLAHQPVHARPPRLWHRARLFARRRRALCAWLLLAGMLFASAFISIVVLYLRAEDAATEFRAAKAEAAREAANLELAQDHLREVQNRLVEVGRSATTGLVEASNARIASTQNLLEQRAIIATTFDDLEQLRTTLLADPSSQIALIEAYLEVGSMHGTEWFAPREDVQTGYRALQRAVELARRLVALQPNDNSEALLLKALAQCVQSSRKVDDLDNGNAAADEGVAVARARLAANPESADAVGDLVVALWARSDLQVGNGDGVQGINDARTALDLATEGRQRFPESPRFPALVGWSHFRLGIWWIYLPDRFADGLEQLRLAGDAGLLAYEREPTRDRRQGMRTQIALEVEHRSKTDPSGAMQRAELGMAAIARHGLNEPWALLSWTRLATAALPACSDEQRQLLLSTLETHWTQIPEHRLPELGTAATLSVLDLCAAGLSKRPGLQALFRATLQAAAQVAESSDVARSRYQELLAALPGIR